MENKIYRRKLKINPINLGLINDFIAPNEADYVKPNQTNKPENNKTKKNNTNDKNNNTGKNTNNTGNNTNKT